MALYLITYDLNKPGQDYNALYAKIKSIAGTGNFIHPLESVWVIKYAGSATQLYDSLDSEIDWNDHIFICGLKIGQVDGWIDKADIEWIDVNLD